MTRPRAAILPALLLALVMALPLLGGGAPVRADTLAHPLPPPSANAALRYQRALLYLAHLPDASRALLGEPIWTALPRPAEEGLPEEIGGLLTDGALALNDASLGSRLEVCDFGLDFEARGAGTDLVHVGGMVELGRLVLLRGAWAEKTGDWKEAAVTYFDALRMGRHMNHQRTLLEAVAGLQILEESFFALARWATTCPERALVARAFGLLESLVGDLTQPGRTVAWESAHLTRQLDVLIEAYPDGPWAVMVLGALGEGHAGLGADAAREKAIQAAVARGVPEAVFASKDAFARHVSGVRTRTQRYAEALSACVALSPFAALARGRRLHERYGKGLGPVLQDLLVDPVDVVRFYARHGAASTLARVTLALAASRTDAGFPVSLDAVKGRFGGAVPTSPYDGSPLEYAVAEDGSSFGLVVPEAVYENWTLPRVAFESQAPAAAGK